MYKILVVEDEAIVRNGICRGVDWESIGAMIVGEAANGAEGIAAVERCRPHLVITDVRMPCMDGIEMLRELRRKQYKIQVILLTAYSDFEYARCALKLGAADYLLKPFQPQELLSAVSHIFHREMEQQIQSPQDILPVVSGNKSKYVQQAMNYISEHYSDDRISITPIARCLGISESHLSHIFRKETNYTVNEYLTRYRMHIAMQLLADCRYKVYEVSEMVGYRDLAYFGSKFKKIVGMTPSQYQSLC